MKILSVAADVFNADGRTDRQTYSQTSESSQPLLAILRNRLKTTKRIR